MLFPGQADAVISPLACSSIWIDWRDPGNVNEAGPMDTIFIRDLIVRGIIGVNAWERENPQDFVINIDLNSETERVGITDNINDSIDYQSVADKVSAHASRVGRYTVEAIAADVAEIVLTDTRVHRVRVRVEKPGAVPGCNSVGVEIDRSRRWLADRLHFQHPDSIQGDQPNLPASTAASSKGFDERFYLESQSSEHHWACLGLGSNTDFEFNLSEAIRKLRSEFNIDAVSSVWESSAVGDLAVIGGSPDYVNAAILVRTRLTKNELVATMKRIENELGRVRSGGHDQLVTIDIDLLLFDGAVLKKDLWNLAYRAIPVAQLIPSLCSPETSEPLWKAARRLAAETRLLPRFDMLRLATNPPYHN